MIKLKSFLPLFILALQSAFAQTKDSTSIVGGGTMYPSKNVLENLKHSKDHTNFVQAVNAADLVNTLQGVGPYTVFAPTNEAFKKLPKGMWEILLRPDQKANLADHIDYHIIAGLYSVKDLSKLVKDNHGKAPLSTLSGAKLYVTLKDENTIVITDEYNKTGQIIVSDVNNSNAITHVVDEVFRPKLPKDKNIIRK